ncbi:unnamed protein product [Lupinus luteus]|uniref:Uncharacterized protein n=1 Tax=Lupinus luteus TaxID=3873 RepID=A0AAV1XIL4_LUPLU
MGPTLPPNQSCNSHFNHKKPITHLKGEIASNNASEVIKPSSLELSKDSIDGSPPLLTVYTDVVVVP